MLIDTHCHIDRFPDPEALVAECEANSVQVVAVTNLPSHYEMALPHLASSNSVIPALGFHPLSATLDRNELKIFQRHAKHAKYIGEIGLDFSKVGFPSRQLQEDVLGSVLHAIQGTSSFITLHSRGAEREVLQALQSYKIPIACFHWYTGGVRVLEDILSAGHFISINAAMLGTQKGVKLLEIAPLNQLLAESDGPYAKRNRQVCTPKSVMAVYQAISDRFNLGLDEVHSVLEGVINFV